VSVGGELLVQTNAVRHG